MQFAELKMFLKLDELCSNIKLIFVLEKVMDYNLFFYLSEFINRKNPLEISVPKGIVSIAKAHQISPILFYQTKDNALYQSYLHTISIYTQRVNLLEQIKKALDDTSFYTVKGIAVSKYYPVPQLRTMADCDIVVHEGDKEKVKQAFLSIGFHYIETKWDSAEWHFEKQGLDFELHHRLLYDEIVNTEQEKVFADTAWEYVQDHELDVNFHFVFILIHLKKHLLNSGVGLRQFMDLAVMSKNADLDRSTISGFLKQVGLEKFAGVCSALCARWFGVSLPVETIEISDEFFDYATETILSNGVFGFNNPDNRGKSILNSVGKQGKFGSVIHKFFPSYSGCAGTLKYKWIKGKPYLMPILWIYRPFEFLFSGRIKEGFERISAVAKSDKAMAERSQELSAWGL